MGVNCVIVQPFDQSCAFHEAPQSHQVLYLSPSCTLIQYNFNDIIARSYALTPVLFPWFQTEPRALSGVIGKYIRTAALTPKQPF